MSDSYIERHAEEPRDDELRYVVEGVPDGLEPGNYRVSFSGYTEVQVYLTVGVRTSQGPGPGPKTLPASEANALIGMKYAVYGDRAQNEPLPEPTARRFGSPP